jgi:hypothetical protein
MSFRPTQSTCRFPFAALALIGVLAGSVQAEDKQPGTTNAVGTARARQSPASQDGLKQLEDDLFRPLQGFSPKSSLDGVMVPPTSRPTPPVRQSKRAKELSERRKNWAFTDPEDVTGSGALEEMYQLPEIGPDGQEKKKLSPLEQFYRNLDRQRSRRSGFGNSKEDSLSGLRPRFDGRDEANTGDDPKDSSGLSEAEQKLKKLFGSDATSRAAAAAPSRNIFADIFGAGEDVPTPEDLKKKKRHTQELIQFYGLSPAPTTGTGLFDPLGPAKADASVVPGGLPTPSHADAFSGQSSGTINPLFSPGAVAGVNPRAFSPPSLTPTLPITEPPKAAAPVFAIPQRKF